MQNLFGLHIIRFDGGLGNQMFEYAFYLSMRHQHSNGIYAFDTIASNTAHNGFELDRIFGIDSCRKQKRLSGLRKLAHRHLLRIREVTEDNFMTYCPRVYNEKGCANEYVGYWQTEKYFLQIEDEVRRVFRFREELLSERTKTMSVALHKNAKSISLHVRRGDYKVIDNTKTFGIEYYDAAVKLLREKHNGGDLIVFSDDPEWAKNNLPYKDMTVVDWNNGVDSWQDMYLMSQCTYNIIANSSFSWWGAWLNSNPEKLVIAPKKWMKDEPEHADIIPTSWIRL